MAEAQNGDRTKLQAAAESALLQLAARAGIAILMTICVPVAGWVGYRLVDSIDRLGNKIDRQHNETVEKIGAIDVRLTRVETRLEYTGGP